MMSSLGDPKKQIIALLITIALYLILSQIPILNPDETNAASPTPVFGIPVNSCRVTINGNQAHLLEDAQSLNTISPNDEIDILCEQVETIGSISMNYMGDQYGNLILPDSGLFTFKTYGYKLGNKGHIPSISIFAKGEPDKLDMYLFQFK